MNDLRAAAELALGALEYHQEQTRPIWRTNKAIEALEAALAEPVQEPVALMEPAADNDSAYAYADGWNDCVNAHKQASPPQRPAEPVQEPVAYSVGRTLHWHEGKGMNDVQLYATPPQRKPLTDEEISKVAAPFYGVQGFRVEAFARAIEAAHGIKEKT